MAYLALNFESRSDRRKITDLEGKDLEIDYTELETEEKKSSGEPRTASRDTNVLIVGIDCDRETFLLLFGPDNIFLDFCLSAVRYSYVRVFDVQKSCAVA
jgi:hypothetical protein